ncbi:hypothetical protein SAMN05660691_00281 [Rheinheimera pacifica]|uniref:Uncharacterized protein n=1 Tax=Rheinheimera pacifica TaxID=173990 RepID=A0A1H6JFY7_9GAMM|nr:hypothetical protein [Rheinheimera pacifica]SEH57816.1 hypothetical protein SAMN05660691_00281 [Rheinheimera pacifica]
MVPNYDGFIGLIVTFAAAILWVLLPVFIYLIGSRVRRMLRIMESNQIAIEDLNRNVKILTEIQKKQL